MPTDAPAAISTLRPRPRHGEPQPALPAPASEPASAKRDLASWWKGFKRSNALKKEEEKARGIFGVPLITSIPYANVAISLFNETGESYIYGYVPIVVAKCGVFLKEKATDVEGIFRLAGSEKRIKELKIAFDTPPRWGKGLDWTGYTVHDAANILRRYFNQLPEPIIPLQHYDPFRQPLRNHQAEAVGQLEGQAPSIGGFDPDAAVRIYQHRIKELPSLNRQLLLYILDLLAVFAAKSDVNKMTTSNLAAIFQPGLLSHPQHDMSPQDYRLSQDVLIFLIDNQDHFLIGMEGTAVDEGTVKHVQSGPSTPQARTPTTPGRNKSGLGRSASAASSAGADSLRKYGAIRRNVSTSSRQSRHSQLVPSPTTPSYNSPTGSGVYRSNTVPSNRSPAIPGARFSKERTSGPPTPSTEEPRTPFPVTPETVATSLSVPQPTEPAETQNPTETPDAVELVPEDKVEQVKSVSLERAATTPVAVALSTTTLTVATQPTSAPTAAAPGAEAEFTAPALPTHASTAPPDTTPTFEGMPGAFPPPSPGVLPPTPSEEVNAFASPRSFGPASSGAAQFGRRSPQLTPTREMPEFMEGPVDSGQSVEPAPVVRTFTHILSKVSPTNDDKGRPRNKLQKKIRGPSGANPSAHSSMHSLTGPHPSQDAPPSPLPRPTVPQYHPSGSKEVLGSYNTDPISSRNSGVTLKPNMSPSASFRSHSTATEYSETEQADDGLKEEKRSFWKSHKRNESKATPTASQTDVHGSVPGGDKSMSSFGSSGWGGGHQTFQHDSHQALETSMPYNLAAENKEHGERKSVFGFFKRHEHKDRPDRKNRTQSPPGSSSQLAAHQSLVTPGDVPPRRGRSMDVPRTATSEGSSDVTPTATTPNSLATLVPQIPQAHQVQQQHGSTPRPAPATQTPHVEPETRSQSPPANQLQPHYQSLIPRLDADSKPPQNPSG
ncbi:RhoGAP-domain-containing protein [Pleomassaria siparia CBS 279.74]|uniref:RhoGAP-domain-containing protein n=1 Tax=Pleomassaria siparia CBS 279.74 TaxID=1314801 RepID=A0A6G1JZJ4_9PLEO|nr:RhoGAP-domain-containing protein [Pleomassaria siparia CBS 279.74]